MSSRIPDVRRDDPPRPERLRPLVRPTRRVGDSTTLPSPADPLIGRERELASLTAMVRGGVRLLTFTGPGGVGKTRLAVAAAAAMIEDFGDGIVFVPLAGIADADLVPATTAAALDLHDTDERPLSEQIASALRPRELLLVLDTFERLLPAAGFIGDLVNHCPRLTVLVTSRARLNVSGEHTITVAPLPVPSDDGAASEPAHDPRARFASSSAMRLFVARAQAAASDFALTDENAAPVADICRRLDGLPLAIELAAAWIRLLPPRALLDRLDQSLELLIGGAIDLPPRLRSLREAIAWSYDLLSPAEQAFFRCLAVFRGSFTLDAAEAVYGAAPPCGNPSSALALIGALVDQSLLSNVASGAGDNPRFQMLDTIREFAAEQLLAHHERDDAEARHTAWFLALAERAEPELQGPDQRRWLDRLDAEIDNLRAAISWLLARGDTLAALRLTGATGMFWLKQGRYAEGRAWLARVLAADGNAAGGAADRQTAVHAKAHAAAGSLAFVQGDFAAAIASHEAALTAGRRAGAPHEIARALNALGGLLIFSGRVVEGRQLLEEVLPLYDGLPDAFLHGMTLTQLGLALFQQGETERALSLCAEAVAVQQAAGDWWGAGVALTFLGLVALGSEDLPRASAAYAECVDLGWRNGETRLVAEPLFGLGVVAAQSGQPLRAARLLGGATALAESIGFGSFPMTQAMVDRATAAARAALGPSAFAAAWAAGRRRLAADVVAEALGETTVADAPISFTPRERAVLRLLTEYKTDKEIGAALYISHRTAMWHVGQILRKLGVATRAEAADYAIRHGLA